MKYMDDNGFISLGCNTDKDCAYKDDDGTEVYNYQSCRHYPDKGVPIMNSTNGCICSNYVTTAEVDMDNGRVYCIRNDAGSIALYVFDSLVLFLQFIIIICCLHLLLFFALAKLNQLWTKGMQRDRPVSMIKRHSLVCLFFLFMSSLCFSIFRVTTLMTGILGLRSDIDIPKRQGRLSEGSLRAFIWLAYMFLELCCLHFTILWLSTTRALFSPEANENSKSCFNVKFYKRFINLVQIAIFLLIVIPIALRVEMTLVNIVVFLTGVVIVYEFAWGCGNIIRMLRVIASWSKSSKISSVIVDAGIHEADTSTKLLRVADKIEKLSSKLRKAGGCLILFYGTYALLNYLGYEYSPTTSSNLLTIFNRGGDTCYVAIEFVLFNFLQDAIFPEYSAVIKKRQPPRFEPHSAAVVVSEADAQGSKAAVVHVY